MKRFSLLLVFLIALGTVAVAFSGCEESEIIYKNGVVTNVVGDARVHRSGGSMPAYNGLILKHGDKINTESGASVAIALDGDKYALIEAGSQVTLSLYENDLENVALISLERGTVYTEADQPIEDGLIYGIVTADGMASGGAATYRVALSSATSSEPRKTLVQAIKGSVSVTALGGKSEKHLLSEGYECRIDESETGAFFAAKDVKTDPYSLPDRYIELGEDGVFDFEGTMIPKPPSGDLTIKELTVLRSDGSKAQLIPEFNNEHPGYVVEVDDPASLTVIANHPKTHVWIQCYHVTAIETSGNRGSVYFDNEGGFGIFVVSILVKAENGDETRFSVNIVPPES